MEEVIDWWKKGMKDFDSARVNFKEKLYDVAAFLCQQSIEKGLKALYLKKFKRLIKTHDLYYLGKKLNLPKNLLGICEEISSFYVETRYPDTYAEFDEENVSPAIEKTEKVLKWIKNKI